MKKKRLLHLITSLRRGGAESLLIDLIKALPEYDHYVIAFYDGPNRKKLEEHEIPTFIIRGYFCIYDPLFCIRLVRAIKHIKPAVMHCGLWSANFLGRMVGRLFSIPFISVVHLNVATDGTMRNFLDTCTFFLAQHVIAVSDEVAQSLIKKKFIPAQRISLIANGINCEAVRQEAIRGGVTREQYGLEKRNVIIGCVGRFIERKNIHILIQAFAKVICKIPHARLMLVGFGEEEASLRSLAERLGMADDIIFVVGHAAYPFYRLFDCFVLPSRQEGLSIALLEAMSLCIPCIVTSIDGQHEVITNNKTGLVVPIDSIDALAESLVLLLHDANLRKALADEAYAVVQQQFSMQRMAKEYQQLLDKISV